MKSLTRVLPLLVIVAAIAAGSSRGALAQEMAVSLKAGTAGIGGDLTFGLSDQLNLRGGAAGFSYNGTRMEQQITYDTAAKLLSGFALLDFHPAGGAFRISVGAVVNKNVVTGQSTGGILIINGVPYNAKDVGSLTGEVRANTLCPYLGIGIGNAVGRGGAVKLVLDVGVYYMGSPKVSLTANPASPGQIPPGFAEDLEQERKKIEDDLSKYRYYPVISLGVSIQL